jgi:V8-like Glu-specific endopeptidase
MVLGAAAVLALVSACGSGHPGSSAAGTPSPAVTAGPSGSAVVTSLPTPSPWLQARLQKAVSDHGGDSRTARSTTVTARVGALFSHEGGTDHFCTGSVVQSSGGSLVVTAAHCVHGGKGGGYNTDVVFVPDYRNGSRPEGEWPVSRIVVDQRWADSSDPDLDVAFLVLGTVDGKKISQVLGANKLGIGLGFTHTVVLTGYPSTADAPLGCINTTSQQSTYQLRIACKAFSGGTSGSPWLTGFDRATHTGTVIGVIGGYQEGGDTADVSYSPYFDNDVLTLYNKAVSLGG